MRRIWMALAASFAVASPAAAGPNVCLWLTEKIVTEDDVRFEVWGTAAPNHRMDASVAITVRDGKNHVTCTLGGAVTWDASPTNLGACGGGYGAGMTVEVAATLRTAPPLGPDTFDDPSTPLGAMSLTRTLTSDTPKAGRMVGPKTCQAF